MVLALEESAVLIKNVIGTIAGQALESGIGIDEDAVVAFLLGDDDAIVGVFDHQLQKLCVDHEPVHRIFMCNKRSVASVRTATARFAA